MNYLMIIDFTLFFAASTFSILSWCWNFLPIWKLLLVTMEFSGFMPLILWLRQFLYFAFCQKPKESPWQKLKVYLEKSNFFVMYSKRPISVHILFAVTWSVKVFYIDTFHVFGQKGLGARTCPQKKSIYVLCFDFFLPDAAD